MRLLKRGAIFLLVFMLLLGWGCKGKASVANVGNEEVTYQQAQLYLALTLQEYEKIGGSQIWEMKIGGLEAYDAACEAALDSMILSKTVLSRIPNRQKVLTLEEEQLIEGAVDILYERLGTETLQEWDITREEVKNYIQEDYYVSTFISQMNYSPDMGEVDRLVEEAFVWYDNVNVAEYMEKIRMDTIFLYCGQMMDDQWVSYSEEVRQAQYAKAEEALERIKAGEPFDKVRKEYSEEEKIRDAAAFNVGVVRTDNAHMFYKGQLERNLWEVLFRIPAGQISEILECEQGYLIVRVMSYPAAGKQDEKLYRKKLQEAKDAYRLQVIEEQSAQGINRIIEQWQEELYIHVDTNQWQQIMESVRMKIGAT